MPVLIAIISYIIFVFRRKKAEFKSRDDGSRSCLQKMSSMNDKLGFLHVRNGDRTKFATESLTVKASSSLFRLGETFVIKC